METPRETAERLADAALTLSPHEFEEVFNQTLAATEDVEVQSRLMWVAGMYLDRHPGAFRAPRPLAEHLLQSANYDHVLAGLKAIRHSGASSDEIISHFTAVMSRSDWDQRYAALYQLSMLLGLSPQVADVGSTRSAELRGVLLQIASNAPDKHARDCAARCIARLPNST